MIFDSLTWSALSIIFISLLAVIWSANRSNKEHRQNIRRVAQHSALLLGSEDAIKLCRAIHKLHPEACPGLDYSIKLTSSGGAEISEWNHVQVAPTHEQLIEAINYLDKEQVTDIRE